MAVQQNRKTRSKRDKRRTHDGIPAPALSVDSLTGEVHRRHHITKDGYYQGKQVRVVESSESEDLESE